MTHEELTVFHRGGSFFEGPRWHDGYWYVSDFFGPHVLRFSVDGKSDVVARFDGGRPSGIGWLPDGTMLVISMTEQRIYAVAPDGTARVHAEVGHLCNGHLNDMVVDDQGRAYAGSLGLDVQTRPDWSATGLMLVEPDGSARLVADDLQAPNGAVITPDGATLIVGESLGARYTAFTILPDGSLTDRRVWAQLGTTPTPGPLAELPAQMTISPDGCTLDAEGHIWMADATGGPVRRLAPGGASTDEIPPPAGLTVWACMLGGNDGRTLLMCAAPADAHFGGRDGEAMLLVAQVEVPHAGQP